MFLARLWICAFISVWSLAPAVPGKTPTDCTQADVDAGKQYCATCLLGVACVQVGPPTPVSGQCPAGKVCQVICGVASCVNSSSAPECMCSSTTSMCDPYDSDYLLVCDGNGTGIYDFDCSTNPNQTCVDGICDEPVTPVPEAELCSGNAGQLVPILPACTSYSFCDSENTTAMPPVDCSAGKYFDFASQNCLPLPPDPCANCEGSCPDPFDCSFYHSCVGGVSEVRNECPVEELYYDPDTKVCTDIDTVCAPITKCTFNTITNSETRINSNDVNNET